MYCTLTDGLDGIPAFTGQKNMPLFLTDDYEVLEAPTLWAVSVRNSNSGSPETLKQYSSILERYFQFLDDNGYGAKNWQSVDEDVILHYIRYLVNERDEISSSINKTIDGYIARIADFYDWAKRNGYSHYWVIDRTTVYATIDSYTAMVNTTIQQDGRVIKTSRNDFTNPGWELSKFVRREHFDKAIELFEDCAYMIIATIIWQTALRAGELLQLPFHGIGFNKGLKHYSDEELEEIGELSFTFKGKGGNTRRIPIKEDLWKFICQVWMPERCARAEKYAERHEQKHGIKVYPPNNKLFLSEEGRVITYRMLYDNFKKIKNNPAYQALSKKPLDFRPQMLRHSFCTYFIYEALAAKNMLGDINIFNPIIDAELKEWTGHADVKPRICFMFIWLDVLWATCHCRH